MGCPSPGPGRCIGDRCPVYPLCPYEPRETFFDDIDEEDLPEHVRYDEEFEARFGYTEVEE